MLILRKYALRLLVAFTIIGSTWQTASIAYFHIFRTEITQKYCVNKNQPKLDCRGLCHLKKTLRPTKTSPDQAEGSNQQSSEIFLVFQSFESLPYPMKLVKHLQIHLFDIDHYADVESGFLSQILDPPDFFRQ